MTTKRLARSDTGRAVPALLAPNGPFAQVRQWTMATAISDAETCKEAAAAVEELADAAAAAAVRALLKDRLPGAHGSLAPGRFETFGDQHYHIQILAWSLAANDADFFTYHVRWLCTALTSRSVPLETLARSFSAIDSFYKPRLARRLTQALSAVIGAGLSILNSWSGGGAIIDTPGLDPLPQSSPLVARLVAGDEPGARSVVASIAGTGVSYVAIATRLIQPALYRVGTLWHRNEISIGQEHRATAISRSILSALFQRQGRLVPEIGRRALFAAVEQDLHILGPQIVADAFALAGWSVRNLGARTSLDRLIAEVVAWKPELVGLSVSLSQQLPELKRTVSALRSELSSLRPMVMVGGRPTNQFADIWRWTGADAWSPDAENAVREAR